MKFTRYLFLTALLIAATIPAMAQNPGVYTLLSGGTTTLPLGSTNVVVVAGVTNVYGAPGTTTNLAINISEYDNVGLTYSATGVAATTNGVIAIRISKSFNNGTTYDASPSIVFVTTPATPNGAATWTITTNIVCTGANRIAFTLENGSAQTGGFLTNVLLNVHLKSLRVQSQGAGATAGTSPGTPIVVPNFP